jgi:adenosylcobyric acid synthase
MTGALMIQGTGSDVGKSVLVAGLARAYSNRGLTVRPFKPQNMSNNAAVTADGGEIGRAQHLQAIACRTAPTVNMNPVLLKPQSDIGAQVVVLGQRRGNANARAYQDMKAALLPEILDSYHGLAKGADLMLIEGAGSPAEVNLPGLDIANMAFAEAADVPVALVADIDRGGVIASLVGTFELLPEQNQRRITGFIINKFRGDKSLFDSGLKLITDRTGWTAFGVMGHCPAVSKLPAEDAMALEVSAKASSGPIRIAVPRLSRIANFDDFDPLRLEPDVSLNYVQAGEPIPMDCDLIILPGTKATIADMAFVRQQGWDIDILAHHRQGGAVLGICGGYQMLGKKIMDPDRIESGETEIDGLGLLDIATTLRGRKELGESHGTHITSGLDVTGYEIHIGNTEGPDTNNPYLSLPAGTDGAQSADQGVAGCYLHGLFRADEFRHAFLSGLRERSRSTLAYDRTVDDALDELAAQLEEELSLDQMLEVANAA